MSLSEQNETGHNFSNSTSLAFRIVILILVIFSIKGIIQWFIKYKLRYLFRISCFMLLYDSIALLITIFGYSLKDQTISFFFPKWQESTISSLLHPKPAWIIKMIFCIFMGVVRYNWAMPFYIFKENGDADFSHLKSMAKSRQQTVKDLSCKMLRHREPGDLNPVYVNGWIPLIESRKVVQGQTTSVIAVGNKFCVYRGENRQVFVLDTYCPHMGADLSAGGKVIGNCIECPFHGWKFDGETGNCTKIPYSKKIPDTAKVKVWESCEKNGYIFVWHHAENEPPSWEIPSVPEIENGKWIYRGGSEYIVHCHIQEISENAVDAVHFTHLHKPLTFFGLYMEKVIGNMIKHEWQTQWSPDENEPHISRSKVIQSLTMCGYDVPYSRVNMDSQMIGPTIAYMYVDCQFGHGILSHHITTEGPMLQRVVHQFYSEPKLKPFPACVVLWIEAKLVVRDIAIWNNKKFLKNPLLVKEEKQILKFRRWISQFYSEHSPTLKNLRQKTLEW